MNLVAAGRGRLLGFAVLAALVGLLVIGELAPVRAFRLASFDAYQVLAPRQRRSEPVVIVEVDDASLARVGQWPWPRSRLAELVTAIARGRPAALGLDVVMPEADRFSPPRLPALIPDLDVDLGQRLARLPDNDAVLGAALGRAPSVLAVVGLEQREPGSVVLVDSAPVRMVGGNAQPFLPRFAAAFRSVEAIARGAAGHGLINAGADGRVVRRLPLAAVVGEIIVPAIGLDMLRVAGSAPGLLIRSGARGVEWVAVGDLAIPTEPDGGVWIHFTPSELSRFVSAADVLAGAVDPQRFERKLVLVGVTAVGLGDRHATPVAPRMAGVEIHAQLLENIFDGALLTRPRWAAWAEAAFLALGAGVLVLAVPVWPVGRAAVLALAVMVAGLALGFAVYRGTGVLLDGAAPALGVALTYGLMLGLTLTEAQRQRRALRRQLQAEREAAARVAGELQAARRIQMGMLPAPAAVLRGDDRIALYAFLESASIVGGDLYDFFRLDGNRLFFLVGDVSGHGVAGSLFMAVSKALCKSAALRSGDLGAMMRESNAEIARDNPEALFVTVWAGLLDAETGRLEYCNAGHEPAWLLGPRGPTTEPLTRGAGPPLCVIDDFPYATASHTMRPGETICLVTDGVTEAFNGAGEPYGRQRLEALLTALPPSAGVREVGEAIGQGVSSFTAGAAASDDLTVLVVRWNGPGGSTPVSGP